MAKKPSSIRNVFALEDYLSVTEKYFKKEIDTKTYFNGSHPPPPQNTRMVSACIIIPSISVFIKTH